jgi:hypothetical protein
LALNADSTAEPEVVRVDGKSVDASIRDFLLDNINLTLRHFDEANQEVNSDEHVSKRESSPPIPVLNSSSPLMERVMGLPYMSQSVKWVMKDSLRFLIKIQ